MYLYTFYLQVYIAAHVPPGTFELAPAFKWFHDLLNTKYLDIIDEHNDVIISQFYGHEHTDSFRLYDATGMCETTAVSLCKFICSSKVGVDVNNDVLNE